MIEIQVGKTIKQVNTDLTISQYQNLIKKQTLLQTDRLELLSFYLDMPKAKIKNLPKNQVDFVLQYITESITKEKSEELIMTFEHDGVVYGLENDWSKLTWGAWSDFEILSAENLTDNIQHIMAILYRPVVWQKGEKYKIKDYDSEDVLERAQLFYSIPVSYWFSASVFFFRIAEQFITDTNNSLKLVNKINRLILMGWMKLPKFLQKKLPLDFILGSPSNSLMKILPK